MNDKDMEIIRAVAACDMNVSEASRTLFMHRNTVIYHLGRIKKETGLDPQKFCDLVVLIGMVDRMEGEYGQAEEPV